MRHRLTKIALYGFAALAIFSGVVSAMSLSAQAALDLYGRPSFTGYFSGLSVDGRPAGGCGASGKLFCNGNSSNNITDFVNFYWSNLFGGDTDSQRASAFTILSMLGVGGAQSGCFDGGVAAARSRFSEWQNIVQAYNDAGRISWNQNFSFSYNTGERILSGSSRPCGYTTQQMDIFWYPHTDTQPSIVFTAPNGSQAAIKRSCGNMVGSTTALQQIKKPQKPPGGPVVGGGSSANCHPMTINVVVGTDYNGNPVPVTVSIGGNTIGRYTTSQTIDITNSYTTGDPYTVNYTTDSYIYDYKPRLDANGYNVYDSNGNAIFDPLWRADSWTSSVGPCYDYSLTPLISISASVVDPGAVISISPSVNNIGPTKSQSTAWQLSYIIVPPTSGAAPSAGVSSVDPCTYYGGGGRSCSVASFMNGAGAGSDVFYTGLTRFPIRQATVDDLPAGTNVCYALSVNPKSSIQDSTPWANSTPSCVTIAKRPKVQILGGDLISGRTFNGTTTSKNVITGTTLKNNKTYGSWVEYGILATGSIIGMGSGSSYNGGLVNANYCNSSLLSFTNYARTDCSVQGGYGLTGSIRGVAASLGTTSGSFGGGKLDALQGTYSTTGNVTIDTSNISPGHWVVIDATGYNVTVNGNIQYSDGPYSSVSDVPQVVIVAANINIAEPVTRVDSWLVASDTVNTCSNPSTLTINVCSSMLQINGPVMATNIKLRRTAGSNPGNASGDPAEVIDLRPDAYLWASQRSVGTSQIMTMQTTELPPRF